MIFSMRFLLSFFCFLLLSNGQKNSSAIGSDSDQDLEPKGNESPTDSGGSLNTPQLPSESKPSHDKQLPDMDIPGTMTGIDDAALPDYIDLLGQSFDLDNPCMTDSAVLAFFYMDYYSCISKINITEVLDEAMMSGNMTISCPRELAGVVRATGKTLARSDCQNFLREFVTSSNSDPKKNFTQQELFVLDYIIDTVAKTNICLDTSKSNINACLTIIGSPADLLGNAFIDDPVAKKNVVASLKALIDIAICFMQAPPIKDSYGIGHQKQWKALEDYFDLSDDSLRYKINAQINSLDPRLAQYVSVGLGLMNIDLNVSHAIPDAIERVIDPRPCKPYYENWVESVDVIFQSPETIASLEILIDQGLDAANELYILNHNLSISNQTSKINFNDTGSFIIDGYNNVTIRDIVHTLFLSRFETMNVLNSIDCVFKLTDLSELKTCYESILESANDLALVLFPVPEEKSSERKQLISTLKIFVIVGISFAIFASLVLILNIRYKRRVEQFSRNFSATNIRSTRSNPLSVSSFENETFHNNNNSTFDEDDDDEEDDFDDFDDDMKSLINDHHM